MRVKIKNSRVCGPRFSIRFLLTLVFVAAIGSAGIARWYASYNQRQVIESRKRSSDAFYELMKRGASLVGVSNGLQMASTGDNNGILNKAQPRGGYYSSVDISRRNFTKPDVDQMLPYLKLLLPPDGAEHVAIYLPSDIFSDTAFVDDLRSSLPNCRIFDHTDSMLYGIGR